MVVKQAQVYYIVCFLTFVCWAQDLMDTEGFSNDSPFYEVPTEPRVHRVKLGSAYTLKCGHHSSNRSFNVSWEYKQCGIVCNYKDLTKINLKEKGDWKFWINKDIYHINSLNKTHSGLYRCIDKNGVVKKSVIIEVVEENNYNLPPPSVSSLITSNSTTQLNIKYTIQCNVTSMIPPSILWFKMCYGSKCDVEYHNVCYCHPNVNATSYSVGETHISKINIYNARALDSGLYACLAMTAYGEDHKNVTINVPDNDNRNGNSFRFLFLIPLVLVVIPLVVWFCLKVAGRKVVVPTRQQQQTLLAASGESGVRMVRSTV